MRYAAQSPQRDSITTLQTGPQTGLQTGPLPQLHSFLRRSESNLHSPRPCHPNLGQHRVQQLTLPRIQPVLTQHPPDFGLKPSITTPHNHLSSVPKGVSLLAVKVLAGVGNPLCTGPQPP